MKNHLIKTKNLKIWDTQLQLLIRKIIVGKKSDLCGINDAYLRRRINFHNNCQMVAYIEDITLVVIPYGIYQTSLWRV